MIRLKETIAGLAIGIAITLSESAAAENVLRLASVGGALTFDLHSIDEVETIARNCQVYERLGNFGSKLREAPQLAVVVADLAVSKGECFSTSLHKFGRLGHYLIPHLHNLVISIEIV